MSAVDELNDFQSSPSGWLINKLSNRAGREGEALRGAIVDELLAVATFVAGAWLALSYFDRPTRRRRR